MRTNHAHEPVREYPIAVYPVLERSPISGIGLKIVLVSAGIGVPTTTSIERMETVEPVWRIGHGAGAKRSRFGRYVPFLNPRYPRLDVRGQVRDAYSLRLQQIG
jgi:hypothetical protein